MIARETKHIDVVDEMLTLEGLRIIFMRNRAANTALTLKGRGLERETDAECGFDRRDRLR